MPRSRKRKSTRSRRTSCRENRSKRSFSAMFLSTTTALGSIRATRWDCRLRSTGSGRRRRRQPDPMPPQFSCVPLRSTSENCAVLPCFSDFGCFPTAHFLTFPIERPSPLRKPSCKVRLFAPNPLPRISPKSYRYNSVPNRFSSRFSTSPTNGPRSLSRLKAGTHSASLKKSHTRAHTAKQGLFTLGLHWG